MSAEPSVKILPMCSSNGPLVSRAGKPRVDHLRGAVWEVRTSLSNRIARTLFAVESGVMVLLHGFIKKTQAAPQAEVDLAEKRFKEWKNGEK